MYGLFWKGVTKISVYVSFGVGVIGTVLHMIIKPAGTILGFNVASPVNFGMFLMVAGLIIVPLVSLVTPKMKKLELDEIFACYKQKAEVEVTDAIPDDWLTWAEEGETIQDLREVYFHFLKERVHHSELFVKEAQNARKALI